MVSHLHESNEQMADVIWACEPIVHVNVIKLPRRTLATTGHPSAWPFPTGIWPVLHYLTLIVDSGVIDWFISEHLVIVSKARPSNQLTIFARATLWWSLRRQTLRPYTCTWTAAGLSIDISIVWLYILVIFDHLYYCWVKLTCTRFGFQHNWWHMAGSG